MIILSGRILDFERGGGVAWDYGLHHANNDLGI